MLRCVTAGGQVVFRNIKQTQYHPDDIPHAYQTGYPDSFSPCPLCLRGEFYVTYMRITQIFLSFSVLFKEMSGKMCACFVLYDFKAYEQKLTTPMQSRNSF